MEYNRRSTREKWTIMMYMRNFDLMTAYAYALRTSNDLTNDNIDEILEKMERDGVYRPRSGGSTFTGQFKSIQVAWYMFGYYNKSKKRGEKKKLVFSPLGNLLLDNLIDKEKVSKIFIAMLYANGFRQPFSQMDERFNIYAYRLIFELLRDPRLEGKLYNDEVFYLAMFLKTINTEEYENLIRDIIVLRNMSSTDKYNLFKKDESVVGLALHEWRYATGMLESAGIVKIRNDNGNRVIGKLEYGNINSSGQRNASRSYREDYIVLENSLISFVDIMKNSYPYYERPYPDDELSTKFNSDITVGMYSFYPMELLVELGMDTEDDKAITTMLNIANDVNYYSKEETISGEKFEFALTDAFNLFLDVDAERIGGAGNADVECIYYNELSNNSLKKFDIEAKSTKRKLLQVNSRRLQTHRERIGSKYTLIVAPNYAVGVLRDIENQASVIIKASTLANYLYQYILRYGRHITYAELDNIVEDNQGKDITEIVNNYVYNNFGYEAQDLSIKRKKNINPSIEEDLFLKVSEEVETY